MTCVAFPLTSMFTQRRLGGLSSPPPNKEASINQTKTLPSMIMTRFKEIRKLCLYQERSRKGFR